MHRKWLILHIALRCVHIYGIFKKKIMHILDQVLNLVKETEIMISMVLRNIQNSFINFRKIFILLIVSQIISIMSIFFVYGIYGSYAAKMQEIELNTYTISN